jgi:hypothetical protein
MVGGSTNKLTAVGFDQVDKAASTFNAAIISLVGNNSTGANIFGRNKDSTFLNTIIICVCRLKNIIPSRLPKCLTRWFAIAGETTVAATM